MLSREGEIPSGVRGGGHGSDGGISKIEITLRRFRPRIAKAKEEIRRRGRRMVIVVDGKGLIAHPFVDDARRAGGVGAVDAKAMRAVLAETAGDI